MKCRNYKSFKRNFKGKRQVRDDNEEGSVTIYNSSDNNYKIFKVDDDKKQVFDCLFMCMFDSKAFQ